MTIVIRRGIRYAVTTVTLPADLRDWARDNEISMSDTLTKALMEKRHGTKTK